MMLLADEGWPCVRLSVSVDDTEGIFQPASSIGSAIETLVAARQAIGRRAALSTDYHHRLSVAEADTLCQAMLARHDRLPGGADPRRDPGPLTKHCSG